MFTGGDYEYDNLVLKRMEKITPRCYSEPYARGFSQVLFLATQLEQSMRGLRSQKITRIMCHSISGQGIYMHTVLQRKFQEHIRRPRASAHSQNISGNKLPGQPTSI